jgi:Ca2+-binding RTX toxin-like protein
VVYGGDGDDSIFGASGFSVGFQLFGGAGNDIIIGGNTGDTLSGGDGNDTISGADGADTLIGGGGADSLLGGSGSALISGGDGNDTLVAGMTLGSDTLVGGDGADRFHFGSGVVGTASAAFTVTGSVGHVISGFARGTDKITLLTGIFTTGVSPAIVPSSASFGSTNSINFTSVGSDLVVFIHGSSANNYLAIKLSGVSTVDINDFEFL